MNNNLPPYIRMFISSTFADMENERTFFNKVIAPELARLSHDRGVSFFSIDLRWGITAEEQNDKKVLPICLTEIDRSRPFFIGILGNRYGSIVDIVPETSLVSFPWLKGKEGKSVTELEMLYGVIEREKDKPNPDCIFLFRSDELSQQYYNITEDDTSIQKMNELKDRIRNSPELVKEDYHSLEEFKTAIIENFKIWLDKEFPSSDSVRTLRIKWYNGELLRNYKKNESMSVFLKNYLGRSRIPLLIYGKGARGKTTFLTEWQPEGAEKILINCGSDADYRYWPNIAREIIQKISKIDESCGLPNLKPSASVMFQLMQMFKDQDKAKENARFTYYVTDRELEDFRTVFLEWLTSIKPCKHICIVINDIELITNEDGKMLSWLPGELNGEIDVICSSHDDEIKENAEILGWNCKEFPLMSQNDAEALLAVFLSDYGKKLNNEQKNSLMKFKMINYPGYLKYIAEFLIIDGRFHNLTEFTDKIGEMNDIYAVYRFCMDYIFTGLDENEKKGVQNAMTILGSTSIGLSEQECFDIVSKIVLLNPIQWSNVRTVLERFGVINGDIWNIDNIDIITLTNDFDVDRREIHELLGEHFMSMLENKSESKGALYNIKHNTEYSRAAVTHFVQSENWDKLIGCLTNITVLYYLTKLYFYVIRYAWMSVMLKSDKNDPELIVNFLNEHASELKYDSMDIHVASLLLDIHFPDEYYINMLDKRVQENIYSAYKSSLVDGLSDETRKLYFTLTVIRTKGSDKEAYQAIKQVMEEGKNFSDFEKSLFYCFWTQTAYELHFYDEALKVSGKSYLYAIKSSTIYLILNIFESRLAVLYTMQNYDEVLTIADKIQKYSYLAGIPHLYYGTKNLKAMALARNKQFEEARKLYKECIYGWGKMGNQREIASASMNYCNAFFLEGDIDTAIKEAEKAYDNMVDSDSEKVREMSWSVLGNIGHYYLNKKDLEKAENIILKVVKHEEECHNTLGLSKAYHNLIEIYVQSSRFSRAIEVYEKVLDILFEMKDYSQLIYDLKRAIELANTAGYPQMAKNIKSKWEIRFKEIPYGAEIFKGEFKKNTVDQVNIRNLKENIVMAESANDLPKLAYALYHLADNTPDAEEAKELFLRAASVFKDINNEKMQSFSASRAIAAMFNKLGMTAQPLPKKIRKLLTDKQAEIVRLWQLVDSMKIDNNNQRQKFAETVKRISELAEGSEPLAVETIEKYIDKICQYCTAEEIIGLTKNFSKTIFFKIIVDRLVSYMSHAALELHIILQKEFSGPEADKSVKDIEKYITVLSYHNYIDTATLAGNLALIFRRRCDASNTFKYHKMAMELFKNGEIYNHGMMDYYIEALNLATAYNDFGRYEDSLELLRKTDKELEYETSPALKKVRGTIVGNMCKRLMKRFDGSEKMKNEIIHYFKIEEATFRELHEYKDLCISLLNQVEFYLFNNLEGLDVIEDKLNEAEVLSIKYELRDFMHHIKNFSRILDNIKNSVPQNALLPNDINRYIDILKEKLEDFQFESFVNEDNPLATGALFYPKKNELLFHINLYVIISHECEMPELRLIFVAQPKISNPKLENFIYQYSNWWNEQNDYELNYDNQKHLIETFCDFDDIDSSAVYQTLNRTAKLWMIDIKNIELLTVGIVEFGQIQELKEQIVKKLDEKIQ